jgi:hypothetical protein
MTPSQLKMLFIVINTEAIQIPDSLPASNPVKIIQSVRGKTEEGNEILFLFQKFKLAALLWIKRSGSI